MEISQNWEKLLSWVSLILRIAIASLFAAAAISKFEGGIAGTISYFSSTFEKTWLPLFLVKSYAATVMIIEIIITLWLLSGYRLREAWIFTSLFTISLAFGMVVAAQYGTASDNYIYVLFSCAGLLLAEYDRFGLDAKVLKRE